MKKTCPHCKKEKSTSDFGIWRDKRREPFKIRLRSWCKKCSDKRSQKWHQEPQNILKKRVRFRKWYRNNIEKVRQKRRKWSKNNDLHIYEIRKKAKTVIGFHSKKEWEDLKKKYKNMCLKCKRKEPETRIVRDHVIDITSELGIDYIWNIQPLCVGCNRWKKPNTDYR